MRPRCEGEPVHFRHLKVADKNIDFIGSEHRCSSVCGSDTHDGMSPTRKLACDARQNSWIVINYKDTCHVLWGLRPSNASIRFTHQSLATSPDLAHACANGKSNVACRCRLAGNCAPRG